MPTSLRNTINDLASSFAASILDALRAMSLEEILAATSVGGGGKRGPGRPRTVAVHAAPSRAAPAEGAASAGGAKRARRRGRLNRRSAGDIQGLIDQIVAVLEAHPAGLRAEQIRAKLGLEAKELPRPIAEALSSKRISKEGQKRATTYFAKGGGGGGGAKRAGGGGGGGAKRAAKKTPAKAGGKGGRKAGGGKRGRKSAQAAAATNSAPAS